MHSLFSYADFAHTANRKTNNNNNNNKNKGHIRRQYQWGRGTPAAPLPLQAGAHRTSSLRRRKHCSHTHINQISPFGRIRLTDSAFLPCSFAPRRGVAWRRATRGREERWGAGCGEKAPISSHSDAHNYYVCTREGGRGGYNTCCVSSMAAALAAGRGGGGEGAVAERRGIYIASFQYSCASLLRFDDFPRGTFPKGWPTRRMGVHTIPWGYVGLHDHIGSAQRTAGAWDYMIEKSLQSCSTITYSLGSF